MPKASFIALQSGTDGSTSSTYILDTNKVKYFIRAFCLSSSFAPKHSSSIFAEQVYGSDGLSPIVKVALSSVWHACQESVLIDLYLWMCVLTALCRGAGPFSQVNIFVQ